MYMCIKVHDHAVHVCVACFLSALRLQVKFYVDRKILRTRDPGVAKASKQKVKGNWRDTLQTLRESPKIMNLALLVVCYALSHRLFEFAWKGQLRVLYPTTQAYSSALADVSIYTGAAAAPPRLPLPQCCRHGAVRRSVLRGVLRACCGSIVHERCSHACTAWPWLHDSVAGK